MNSTLASTKSVSEVRTKLASAKKLASRLAVAAMALVAMTVVPHITQGQIAASGTFKLAAPAKLGTVALPAGDYKYTVKWTSSLPLLAVTSANNEVSQFIFPSAVKEVPAPVSGKITLAVANGETYVSSLSVSELGLQMFYGAPKTLVAKRYAAPGTALASNVQPAK
jgi:hypothetical protein